MMTYFSTDTFDFLAGLEANNSKDWFEANRTHYENHVKTPAFDLIADLSEGMSNLSPALKAEPRINRSLRRINRDTRFSKDKTPYNPRIRLVFWAGDHPNRSPAMHVIFGAEYLGFGAGVFGLEPADLARYRTRIMDNAEREALLQAQAGAERVGTEWTAPILKRLPKGFETTEDWEHLLRRKSFVMRTHQEQKHPAWVTSDNATDGIMTLTRACLPLIAWLHA